MEFGHRSCDAGLLLTFACLSLGCSLVLAAMPQSGDRQVLVVFPPGTSGAQAIAAATAAGGRLLTARGSFVVVASEGRDYAARARAVGAWFVMRAGFDGCGGVDRSRT